VSVLDTNLLEELPDSINPLLLLICNTAHVSHDSMVD